LSENLWGGTVDSLFHPFRIPPCRDYFYNWGLSDACCNFGVDVAEWLAELFLQGIQSFSCPKLRKYALEFTP
jgi:hypothetical protein